MSEDPLHELKIAFRKRMQADGLALAAALENGPDWSAIETIVHSLAGSAGIFGEPGIGAVAAALDAEFGAGARPSIDDLRGLGDSIARRGAHS